MPCFFTRHAHPPSQNNLKEEEEEENDSPPPTSKSTSSTSTINLSREYILAVHTNSYNEIASKIQQHHLTVDSLLDPSPSSVQQALRDTTHTTLSHFFHSTEDASHLCLSLYIALDRTRSLYAPITHLLDLLPIHTANALTRTHCDWAFDVLLEFDRIGNPFSCANSRGFKGLRSCFPELRRQLASRLVKARRQHRVLTRATQGSGVCLIASTVGLMAAGLVLATHALVAFVASPAFFVGLGGVRDPLASRRRRLRDAVAQLDAAARGTYVLSNDLDTIERLANRLYAAIESDRGLVRLGLDRGRGQRHPIEQVLRQLAKNHPSFLHQLEDLEEHICLYFAAVNRSRSLLLRQILQYSHHNS